MILQALCEYYERKERDLPPFGFEEKAIPFIIVIDKNGCFINLQDSRSWDDGKPIARSERVPKATGRSGAKSYETAYYLWDHYGYVVAQPKVAKPGDTPTDKALDDADKQHLSFKREVDRICHDLPDDVGVNAVLLFLNAPDEISSLKAHETWQECLKIKGCNLSFRLSEETSLICQSEAVINWVKQQPLPKESIQDGFCLITGEEHKVVRLHDSISGINQKPAPLGSASN